MVLRWSGAILFAVATVFAVGWQGIFLNPVMPFFGAPATAFTCLPPEIIPGHFGAVVISISAKFTRPRVEAELLAAGLKPAQWWTDPAGDFAVSLAFGG